MGRRRSEVGRRLLRGGVWCLVPRRSCVAPRSGSESRAAAISSSPPFSGWPVEAGAGLAVGSWASCGSAAALQPSRTEFCTQLHNLLKFLKRF